MVRCSFCGRNEIPEDGSFCPDCGHRLNRLEPAGASVQSVLDTTLVRRLPLKNVELNGPAVSNGNAATLTLHPPSSFGDTTMMMRLPPKKHRLERVEEEPLPIAAPPPPPPTPQSEPLAAIHAVHELEAALQDIKLLWDFLDEAFEAKNRAKIETAQRDPLKPESLRQVATLAAVIERNMLSRYMQSKCSVSDKQLQAAIALGRFAEQYSASNGTLEAQKRLLQLEGLAQIRAHTLDRPAFVHTFLQKFEAHKEGQGLAKLLTLVTCYLIERRQAGALERAEAEAWMSVFALYEMANRPERDRFFKEARLHTVSTPPLREPASKAAGKRVGLFVDLENIWPLLSTKMTPLAFGHVLMEYADQFGEVVCCWACAHSLSSSALQKGLERAGFRLRFASSELQKGPRQKNMADFVLLECINDAREEQKLDVYLIASGDQDFYERIAGLLKQDHTVRLLAAKENQHLSSKYRDLEKQYKQGQPGAGSATFCIDDLYEVVRRPPGRI